MQVKDCMSKDVYWCKADNTISDVAKLMSENHVGCIPVCDNENSIVGVVTDRDIILRSIACDKDTKQTPVSSIMTSSVCCCSPEAQLTEATKIMSDMQIRRLPIVENNKVVGMLTLGDLANSQNVTAKEVSDTVECICECGNNAKNAE